MLGMLSLSAVRGPIDDLMQKLAGPNGPTWLEELKKFGRKEPCWTSGFLHRIMVDSLVAHPIPENPDGFSVLYAPFDPRSPFDPIAQIDPSFGCLFGDRPISEPRHPHLVIHAGSLRNKATVEQIWDALSGRGAMSLHALHHMIEASTGDPPDDQTNHVPLTRSGLNLFFINHPSRPGHVDAVIVQWNAGWVLSGIPVTDTEKPLRERDRVFFDVRGFAR